MSNYLSLDLIQKLNLGSEIFNAQSYQMASRCVIYLELNFDRKYIAKQVHILKLYGFEVRYGNPTHRSIIQDARQGKFTFVVISSAFCKEMDNTEILSMIGQGHRLTRDELENVR